MTRACSLWCHSCRCSPLRAVENFLDIAHFLCASILGSEPHTEVVPYKFDIDETKIEVIATQVKFFNRKRKNRPAKALSRNIFTAFRHQ